MERVGKEGPQLALEELAAEDLIGNLEAKARSSLDLEARILARAGREKACLRVRGVRRQEGVQRPADVDLGSSITRRLHALAAQLSAASVLAKAGRVVRREARSAAHSADRLEVEVTKAVGAADQRGSRGKGIGLSRGVTSARVSAHCHAR